MQIKKNNVGLDINIISNLTFLKRIKYSYALNVFI